MSEETQPTWLEANQNGIDFGDLEVIQIPVRIKAKDYVLVEASGSAVMHYKNAVLGGVEIREDGTRVNRRVADADGVLVSHCLLEVTANGGRKAVPVSTILSWPSKVLKTLLERVKSISEMNDDDDLESLKKERDALDKRIAKMEEGDTDLGNAPSDTEDGSG